MNKTKKVAWHKHLKAAKRHEERIRAAKAAAAAPQRPAAKR